MKRSTNKTN